MPMRLINQATAAPTRKVKAGGIAGALTAAALGALNWWSPEFAAVLGGPVEGAIVVVVSTLTSYMTREKA
jgi:hypothetical protein